MCDTLSYSKTLTTQVSFILLRYDFLRGEGRGQGRGRRGGRGGVGREMTQTLYAHMN
jgi:hypothetical protein